MYNPTLIRNHKLQFTPEEKPDIQAIINKQKGPDTNLERLERLTGINPCFCPVCKQAITNTTCNMSKNVRSISF